MNIIGKMLNNRYEVLEKIGNGGMATVYKAKCHVLNRYVAIKILKDEFTTDSEFIKKFKTEAQSAASLTHPNIVQIYDVINEDNMYYIVMELIQGKTLKEIIVQDKQLSWNWAVNIAIQIASALECAHSHNIIHRDIKPHNIIITEDGIAKVTDFGIAKAVSNSTITAFGTTIGSVHYFSPEHARGGYTDAKSDIYSLGIVMYEMLTSRVPFDADTPVSVALKQVQEDPIEPIKYNEDIPISVNRIILKAMQKDPSLRYQSATEMLQDLRMALKSPDKDFVELVTRSADSPTQKVPTIYEIELEKNNDSRAPKSSGDQEKASGNKKKKFDLNEYFNTHPIQKIFMVLAIIMLLFLIAVFGTIGIIKIKRPKQAVMPKVAIENIEEAMTKDDAIKLLNEAGFENISIEEEYSETVPEGKVISQKPEFKENYAINVTEPITLVVSKGQHIVTLPKVMVGKKIDEVKAELDSMDLKYKITEETNEEKEKDVVISVTPNEGTEMNATEEIQIVVSMGSKYKDVTVPNVVSSNEADAKKALTDAGFPEANIKVVYEYNDDKTDNSVTKQSIEPEKVVKENEIITISVNKHNVRSTCTVHVNLQALLNYTPPSPMANVIPLPVPKATVEIYIGNDRVYQASNSYTDQDIVAVLKAGTGNKYIRVVVNGNTMSSDKSADLSTGDKVIYIP